VRRLVQRLDASAGSPDLRYRFLSRFLVASVFLVVAEVTMDSAGARDWSAAWPSNLLFDFILTTTASLYGAAI